MTRKSWFGVYCILTATAVYGAYRFGVARGADRWAPVVIAAAASVDAEPSVSAVDGTVTESTMTAADPSAAESSASGAAGRVARLHGMTDKHARRYVFQEMLADLTTEKAIDLLVEFEAIPAGPRKTDLMLQLYSKWGEIDGAVAFEHARTAAGRERLDLLSVAAGGWAKVAPDAAWEAMMIQTNNGGMIRPSLNPVLEQIASQDVRKAIVLLDQCQNRISAESGFRTVVKAIADEGRFGEALSAISEITGETRRKELTDQLFSNWGRYDLAEPLKAIEESVSPELAETAMRGLLMGWANVDGQAAFLYSLENADNPAIAESLGAVAIEWGKAASAEELESIAMKVTQNDRRDEILRHVLQPLAQLDPKLAMQHAESMQNEGDRSTCIREIMSEWARADLQEAEQHYYGMKDTPSQVKAVIAMVDPLLAENASPERIYKLTSVFSSGDDREQALLYMANIARISKNRGAAENLKQYISDAISDLPDITPRAKFNIRRRMNQ